MDDDRDFLQRVGHDLRNELNIIKGATDFVLRYGPRLEPKYRDMLERVANASKRFELMLNEFDDARWIGNGTWPDRPDGTLMIEPCNAAPIIESALERLRPVISAREVAVEVEIPEDLPAFRADRDQLRNAIEYLLDLALARSVGKTVRILGHLVDGRATISISDDGERIDPALLPVLLEPFIEKKFMPKPGPGTRKRIGLGLAIARAVFTSQGGDVRAEIGADAGLTLHCTLPNAITASAAEGSAAPTSTG